MLILCLQVTYSVFTTTPNIPGNQSMDTDTISISSDDDSSTSSSSSDSSTSSTLSSSDSSTSSTSSSSDSNSSSPRDSSTYNNDSASNDNTNIVSSPSTSNDCVIDRVSAPSTSDGCVMDRVSAPSTCDGSVMDRVSAASTSDYHVMDRVSAPSTSDGSVMDRVSAASTSDYHVMDRVSAPFTSDGSVMDRVSVPSTSDDRVTDRVSAPSTSDDRVTDRVSAPSTSDGSVMDRVSVPSTSDDRVMDRVSVPSTSDDRVMDRVSAPSTSDDHVTDRVSTPSTSDGRAMHRVSAPATSAGSVMNRGVCSQDTITPSLEDMASAPYTSGDKIINVVVTDNDMASTPTPDAHIKHMPAIDNTTAQETPSDFSDNTIIYKHEGAENLVDFQENTVKYQGTSSGSLPPEMRKVSFDTESVHSTQPGETMMDLDENYKPDEPRSSITESQITKRSPNVIVMQRRAETDSMEVSETNADSIRYKLKPLTVKVRRLSPDTIKMYTKTYVNTKTIAEIPSTKKQSETQNVVRIHESKHVYIVEVDKNNNFSKYAMQDMQPPIDDPQQPVKTLDTKEHTDKKITQTRKPLESAAQTVQKPFSCKVCFRKLPECNDLKAHMKKSHPHVKPHHRKCDICGKMFYTQRNLNVHKLRAHPGTASVSSVTQHQSSEHKKGCRFADDLQCDVCEQIFEEAQDLTDHKNAHITTLLKSQHKCRICDMKFNTKSGLKYHKAKGHTD